LKGKKEATDISFRHFTQFGSDIPSEFNGSSNISGLYLSDTCLAFANAKGIVIFNPRQLLLAPLPVNVLIEPVKGNDTISTLIGSTHHVEFNPVIPYHGNIDELDIEYHLTNSDKDWHTLPSNSIISYNNLKPGEHNLIFRIRHQHAPEEKQLELTATTFYVPYKWYQTNWFKALALILVAAVVIVTHNTRIWYLRKRKRELEEMVRSKTHELKETNDNLVDVIDELSRSEHSLKQSNFLKDEYYAVLTHDLRSPLKFLSFNLGQLLERFPGMQPQDLKQALAVANQTSYDIHKLIDEFVYWIQDNEQQLVAQPAPAIVDAVVNDARKIYDYALHANNNEFSSDIEPGLVFITDPKLLFIILRNAVDNANKYCRNGKITVSAKTQGNMLNISVADTGRGISEEMVAHLSSLQYENVQLGYKQRKSLGFYIMAKLTKKLNGSYTIISAKDKGTELKFSFPELNLSHENTHSG
jgi:signal transduction histidine kinase